MNYDLLVIGDEQEGIERAFSVARDGRRVAIVQPSCQGPSLDQICRAGQQLLEHDQISLAAWNRQIASRTGRRTVVEQSELDSLGIDWFDGTARFVASDRVAVVSRDQRQILSANEIVLSCGTRSRRSSSLIHDGRFVMNLESLLAVKDLPRTAIVVGAGQSGLLTAMLLGRMGVEVTLIDEHRSLFDVCDLLDPRLDSLQTVNIAFRLGDEAIGTELRPDLQVAVRLASGRLVVADLVVVCVGREGRTAELNSQAAGVGVDEHGRVWCDADRRTWSRQISAVGSVIGFSGHWQSSLDLSSRSMQSGQSTRPINSTI